jgi:hypothetical protein
VLLLKSLLLPLAVGDHSLTALAIGKMLGIQGNNTVFTGPEIDGMEDTELENIVLGCNIYARASPENKLRIVRALQVSESASSLPSLPSLAWTAPASVFMCMDVCF